MTDILAVDVALLVPDSMQAWCRRMNQALLKGEPSGFRFDDTHLPHLTLVQQFIAKEELEQFGHRVGSLLEGQAPIRVIGIGGERGGSSLRVEATPELQRLHEEIVRLSKPFARPEGAITAFFGNDTPTREADLSWARHYHARASLEHFEPHVTLGVGNNSLEIEPLEFIADRVGICQLGRFGTCRKVLHHWTLKERA